MVGGALALCLEQDGQFDKVAARPDRERREQLQATTVRRHLHRCLQAGADNRLRVGDETERRQGFGFRRLQCELTAVGGGEAVGEWVEIEATGKGESRHYLGAGDEGVGGVVIVVATFEGAIERVDDRIGLTILDVVALPLPDARTAGIGQYLTTNRFEVCQLTVSFDGVEDLGRAGRDQKTAGGLDAA
ncbi:MAG: hypothetical protein BWY75_01132 [bacterium ADurb.Bin425]|nr:MAG: hypothetical protein BWY75_01132 [bacterium ADurb.Bin425]